MGMFNQNSKSNLATAEVPEWWGMCGVFPGALGVYEGDAWRNKLNFVADRNFHGSGVGVASLADASQLDYLKQLATERDQSFFVHYGIDLEAWSRGDLADLDRAIDNHLECVEQLPLPMAQFIVQKGLHRFSKEMPLPEQMDVMAEVLAPRVARLKQAGLEVSIENHGDYYVSDLVALCDRVPGLSILLDTGNCALIGERLDLIPDAAFPLISSTHFKDHWLAPAPKPLNFQLTGATLGEGHMGLSAFYERLLRLHPNPSTVKMMIEWVPDPEKDPVACLNQSMAYLAQISKGHFKPRKFEA